MKISLQTWIFSNRTLFEWAKKTNRKHSNREEKKKMCANVVTPYVAGVT